MEVTAALHVSPAFLPDTSGMALPTIAELMIGHGTDVTKDAWVAAKCAVSWKESRGTSGPLAKFPFLFPLLQWTWVPVSQGLWVAPQVGSPCKLFLRAFGGPKISFQFCHKSLWKEWTFWPTQQKSKKETFSELSLWDFRVVCYPQCFKM